MLKSTSAGRITDSMNCVINRLDVPDELLVLDLFFKCQSFIEDDRYL